EFAMAKLLIAAAFMAIVAAAYAGDCCTGVDRKTVLRQWESVWTAQYDSNKADIAKEIFAKFFVKQPGAKSLFARVKVDNPESAEFSAHAIRILNGLDISLNLLTDPQTLNEQLAHLSAQHVARISGGFEPRYFDEFQGPLLETLNEVTSGFDEHAWEACYGKIATGLKVKF
ncbi:unnamed protein product, partial [Owenia fusiformis]